MTEDFDDAARRMSDDYWAAKFAPLIPERARDQARAEIERLIADARQGWRKRNPKVLKQKRERWRKIADLSVDITDPAARRTQADAELAVAVYNNRLNETARQRDEPLRTVYSVALRIWTDTIGSDDLAASRTPPDKGGELYGAPLDFMAAIGLLVTGDAPRLETLAKYLAEERAERRNQAARAVGIAGP